MDSKLIFWPVLAQITLIFMVFMRLGVEKARAMKSGNVDMTKTALDNDAWVHMGSNYVPARFRVFLFGIVILITMLIFDASALLA